METSVEIGYHGILGLNSEIDQQLHITFITRTRQAVPGSAGSYPPPLAGIILPKKGAAVGHGLGFSQSLDTNRRAHIRLFDVLHFLRRLMVLINRGGKAARLQQFVHLVDQVERVVNLGLIELRCRRIRFENGASIAADLAAPRRQ